MAAVFATEFVALLIVPVHFVAGLFSLLVAVVLVVIDVDFAINR